MKKSVYVIGSAKQADDIRNAAYQIASIGEYDSVCYAVKESDKSLQLSIEESIKRIISSDVIVAVRKLDGTYEESTQYEIEIAKMLDKSIVYWNPEKRKKLVIEDTQVIDCSVGKFCTCLNDKPFSCSNCDVYFVSFKLVSYPENWAREFAGLIGLRTLDCRKITIDYKTLVYIYFTKRESGQDGWKEFCRWIETLPYIDLFIEKSPKDSYKK